MIVNSPKRSTSDSVGSRPTLKPTRERPTSTMLSTQAMTTPAHTTTRGSGARKALANITTAATPMEIT